MKFALRAISASVVLLAGISVAQDSSIELLGSAIEKFPELFLFRSLLAMAPGDLDVSFDGKEKGVTVLVPTNDAIGAYMVGANISTLDDLEPGDLKTILEYHVMDAPLASADFDSPRGLVIPTRLSDEKFNNRTAGDLLRERFGDSALGQVVFALKEKNSARMLRARQDLGSLTGPIVKIRAGMEQNLEMTAVDGKWGPDNKNFFQIVNKVLTSPKNCSTTIRGISEKRLSALDKALTKSALWPTLNTAFNVTCLAPTTDAFKEAGNIEDKLGDAELKETLLLHTLKGVAYSNYLEDGMTFESLNNLTVRVRIKDGDIYFNNAKVVDSNVLTNNGLIHTLDSVVKQLDDEEDEPTETDSDSPSSTSETEPSESDDAAASLSKLGGSFAIVLLAGFALL